jgi:hypothetical protein
MESLVRSGESKKEALLKLNFDECRTPVIHVFCLQMFESNLHIISVFLHNDTSGSKVLSICDGKENKIRWLSMLLE